MYKCSRTRKLTTAHKRDGITFCATIMATGRLQAPAPGEVGALYSPRGLPGTELMAAIDGRAQH